MKGTKIGVWDASVALERLGPEIAPIVEDQLDLLSPAYRVAAGRALCKIGNIYRGVKALGQVVESQPNSPLARDAAELLGEYGRSQAEGDLVRLLDKTEKIDVRIALARSLWSAAKARTSRNAPLPLPRSMTSATMCLRCWKRCRWSPVIAGGRRGRCSTSRSFAR